MPDITGQIENLSPKKRELFESLLKEKHKSKALEQSKLAIPAIETDLAQLHEPFPLTDMQYAYWLGRNSAFQLGNVATHMYEEFEAADLDVTRLNASWQRLVARHAMLRVIIHSDGKQQVLEHVSTYQIEVTDLQEQEQTTIDTYLHDTRQRMSHQVLPTDQWPLFEIRASLLPNSLVRVHVSIDGLLLDGWSYQLLFREWLSCYQDPEQILPQLEISFRDYVLAEHSLRETKEYQQSLEYWHQRLLQLPPAPALPLAKDPASLTQPHFIRRKGRIEPATWQSLKTRAAQSGLTPPVLLLAVYAEVISTWSKSAHFTLNVPRFNRLPLHSQVNDLLGEFASFTLLEVDNTQLAPFVTRARKLQDQLWRDLDHQQVSGIHVLRELSRLQYKGVAVTMPVVFTNLPHEVDSRKTSPDFVLTENVVYGITQTSQVWLDYQGSEEAGALVFNWDAVEDLFPTGMLDDMFAAFCGLLQNLAVSERVWQQDVLELIPQRQLDLLSEVNSTDHLYADDLLQTLFARQAACYPQQAAVISARRTLTYEDLSRSANQLGRYLREMGACPNQLIAIVMEKGWEQIVGVLGILISGAAYLPIDPKLPLERLNYILKHAVVKVVLTQSWLLERISWPEEIQAICLDQQDLSMLDDSPLAAQQSSDDLAYVIYTSGSTGLPKGVMIAQRGVVNAINYTNERFNLSADDRVLALTALHHDMSVYDIFGLLSVGGTIILPSNGALDPAEWFDLLNRERITIWNSVPAMLEMLVDFSVEAGRSTTNTLRLAFLGGDWIRLLTIQRLQSLTEDVQIVSVGGPTETTLWNICYPVTALNPTWRSIPYGKPIANTKYYVLNEQYHTCPLWVPGELCCAGVGLTKGYWQDKEKTAASFMQHPRTGERLYRTGDLGRYLPDGSIEFLGRKDLQIKINGMRIEIEEIEAVLGQHPSIRSVAVTAVEKDQTKRLVAHVVLQQDTHEQSASSNEFFSEITAQQAETLLQDKSARIQFKLNQHGLRSFAEETQEVIQFKKRTQDQAVLEQYSRRRSYRQFLPEPLALEQLSDFLGCLAQVELLDVHIPKYLYPSGGGLYPVQAYLYIQPGRVEGVSGGTYYYHPQEHALVLLNKDVTMNATMHIASNQAIFQLAAFSLFLVAQMSAIEPMYGSLAREFCFLEAGYMGQLLMDTAPTHQIGLCPLGSVAFTEIRSLFLLEETHLLLHSFLGGGITQEQTTVQAYQQEINQTSSTMSTASLESVTSNVSNTLRAFLQEKLPDYMLPSLFRVVESLPLTPNGKVDRKALSSPDILQDAQLTRPYAPPTTDLERVIATIWQEVLQVEHVSIYDNFAEVGGNSLHIVQIHRKLQDVLQKEIVVVELFQYPTIAALAESLSFKPAEAETTPNSSVVRAESRRASRRRARLND